MYQIGLTWYAGTENGGTPVIDYRLWYAIESGSYSILEASLTSTSYVALSLTSGTTYKFKVQSSNAFGYSDFSDEVEILAASKPTRPSAPTTTWSDSNDQVTVSWVAPSNNGAVITSYSIYIRQNDGMTYSLELTDCDGTTDAIISATSC
jgi:hypothetical protein